MAHAAARPARGELGMTERALGTLQFATCWATPSVATGLASVDQLSQPPDVLIHSRSTTAMRRTISPIQKRQRMMVRSPAITMITVDISPIRL
jgi:hypothetical protein